MEDVFLLNLLDLALCCQNWGAEPTLEQWGCFMCHCTKLFLETLDTNNSNKRPRAHRGPVLINWQHSSDSARALKRLVCFCSCPRPSLKQVKRWECVCVCVCELNPHYTLTFPSMVPLCHFTGCLSVLSGWSASLTVI